MDASYWNTIAPNYEDEIFNLFRHDKNNKLQKLIRQYADPGTAADFGCGIGHGLPLLAKHFDNVHAYDLSSKNIRKCQQLHSQLSNIQYRQADLARTLLPSAKYTFALCVCCLIMPSLATREKLLANILRSVKRGGHLLLVVPSLESSSFVSSRLIQWNLRVGMSAKKSLRAGFDRAADIPATDIRQGVLPIEGVRTKHFCREELLDIVSTKVAAQQIFKIQYDWNSVFERLPKRLQTALPWDWALLIEK